MLPRKNIIDWPVAAAVLGCLTLLLGLNALQPQFVVFDLANSWDVAVEAARQTRTPAGYQVLGRAEIMLHAAGSVLN